MQKYIICRHVGYFLTGVAINFNGKKILRGWRVGINFYREKIIKGARVKINFNGSIVCMVSRFAPTRRIIS